MSRINKIATDKETATCYHCGEPCRDEFLHFNGKKFCCSGCRLVYEVLQENDLCNYYDIADAPGTNRKNASDRSNRFDYLDDRDVEGKLVDYRDEDEIHITFHIPLIHCASCIWLLENLNKLHEGIVAARVDFIKKKVQVKFQRDRISLKEVVLLLSKIGYEPEINLADVDHRPAARADRQLIYKLAVAGFCFGNMMFFSLPEYFSEAELMGDGFKRLFNYLNVILALPVFFYAATDYYKSAWFSLRQRAVNMDVPIALGIVTLFTYSLYEIFILGQEGYMDTLGGLLFFLLIGKLFQQKTYDALSFDRDYKSYFPIAVTKIVNDDEEVVALIKLKVGDVIVVRNEELIPADSILVEGDAHIDYSFVTGEEVPVVKKKGELIFAGGRQKGRPVVLVVQKLPSQGYLTDLWNNDAFDKKEESGSLASLATQISGKFTLTVLLIAVSALVFWSFSDFSMGIKAFTAVLIITCPCALAMSTPFTLGNTQRVFGHGKLYLKNAHVIEKMAKLDTVVFDKTGTLTDPSEASINYAGVELSAESQSILKGIVSHSVHPLSNRINRWLEGVKAVRLTEIQEFSGKGLLAIYKDQQFCLGSAEFTGVIPVPTPANGNLVYFTVEGILLGYFIIESGLRKGIERIVASIKEDHQIHILSGDHDHERESLKRVFGPGIRMRFHQGPVDKLQYIREMRKWGAKPLMIGDGLNDAGALRESEVGIALTDNVSHFSPASDGIMDASAIHKLPAFLRFAKTSRNIIKASFGLSFTYNLVGVYFAVQGLVSPLFCAVLMPASSISVILFTTLVTNYKAYKNGLKSKVF
ncbi:heavy metal translocating P-type ATPase [Negadavirga shengliensis]|uniref:Heavy metal translocating P-type ATPase n=1 Tax=Negadavirga shengliensis TaxID=1389218 RepID=A0ABV9T4J4_9BACT